jgi:internalin A
MPSTPVLATQTPTKTFNSFADWCLHLKPLTSLVKLAELSLGNNQITDISSLASLTNLTELLLFNNQIRDITLARSLTNLSWLDLYNNQIKDI